MSSMQRRWIFSCISPFLLAAPPALAQVELQRISELQFAPGDAANGDSLAAAQSPDGRFVAFSSLATSLQAGVADENGWEDVLVLDRQTGLFDYVSLSAAAPGRTGNRASSAVAISDDGRWVLFSSTATDLVAGASFPLQSADQAYLFDRVARTTQLVSHALGSPGTAANRAVTTVALSADGRYSLIHSTAGNLVAGGGASVASQAYLFDRSSGDLRLISHAPGAPATLGNGATTGVAVSFDARWVLLQSVATNLVAGLTDSFNTDVFLYDAATSQCHLISRNAANPLQTTGGTARGLTSDGRYVLLDSANVGMFSGGIDGNGGENDVFRWERLGGTVLLVSRSQADPATGGNRHSIGAAMSLDGRYVYYSSAATNVATLPFTDGNGSGRDVYLRDLQSGTTTLVSHAAGNANQGGNGATRARTSLRSISADGRFMIYASEATDLEAGMTDGNAEEDVFRYDRDANGSTLVSRFGAGPEAGTGELASAFLDGSGVVVFASEEPLDPAAVDERGQFDLFAFSGGAVELLTGMPLDSKVALGSGARGTLTPDGRFVAWGRYLWDRRTADSELVAHVAGSPGTPANADALEATPDGRFVALSGTASDLAAGVSDTNGRSDVYLYDRDSDSATLISHRAGSPSQAASFDTFFHWLSADGNKFVLGSSADDLVAGQSGPTQWANLFFYDRAVGNAELISHHHASLTQTTERGGNLYDASPDGRYLVFESGSLGLIPGFVDHNDYFDDKFGIVQVADLYFYDRVTRQATLVSHLPGLPAEGAATTPVDARLAAGNTAIFYTSWTITPEASLDPKIYRWDRASNSNQLALAGLALAPCNDHGVLADLSADGRWLLFTSKCAFVPGDTNNVDDAYLVDRQTSQALLVSHSPGNPATAAGGRADDLSADARRVVYSSPPYNILSNDGTLNSYDRITQQTTRLTFAYFDPNLPVPAGLVEASDDGTSLLVATRETRLAPFDPNLDADLFLVALTGQMFADGFESGNTSAWSLALP